MVKFDQGEPVAYISVLPTIGGNRRVFDQGIFDDGFYDAIARRF
jgi:hypothetical protein